MADPTGDFRVASNFLPALREARAAPLGIGRVGMVPAALLVSRLARAVIACTFDRRAPDQVTGGGADDCEPACFRGRGRADYRAVLRWRGPRRKSRGHA